MESYIMPSPGAEKSKNNISQVLSKNILGVALGFCNLNTLLKLARLNRRIKSVISDEKIFPIFSEYIKETERFRIIKESRDAFYDGGYLIELRNRLAIKFNN